MDDSPAHSRRLELEGPSEAKPAYVSVIKRSNEKNLEIQEDEAGAHEGHKNWEKKGLIKPHKNKYEVEQGI